MTWILHAIHFHNRISVVFPIPYSGCWVRYQNGWLSVKMKSQHITHAGQVHECIQTSVIWGQEVSVVCLVSFIWAVGWELRNDINVKYIMLWGQDSSVGIVTCYRLGGLGIESQWGWDFPHLSGLALGPYQSPVQWVPVLFSGGGKAARAWRWPPHLAPRLKKE